MKKLICLIVMLASVSLAVDKPLIVDGNAAIINGKTVVIQEDWTPADIETRAWFDASDESSITESVGAVSGWADQSTNNYDVIQLTGANQPATGAFKVYGKNTISFSSSSHFLRNTTSLFEAGEVYSLAVMVYLNQSDNFCAIVDGVGTTANRGFLNPSSATQVRYLGNDNQGMSPNHTRQVGEMLVAVIATGTTTSRVSIDGTASSGTIKIANGMTAGLTIGNNITGNAFNMDGAICEIVYARGAWDVATRQRVEGYLAWKWGAQDRLNVAHPYKNRRPVK